MNITLYTNNSENKKMDKSLTLLATVSGEPREEVSQTDAIFIVEATQENINKTNYIYVDAFARYYFVNDKVWVTSGVWRLVCHCDVISTFKQSIRSSTGHVVRNARNIDHYISDNKTVLYANPHVVNINSDVEFSPADDTAILVTF